MAEVLTAFDKIEEAIKSLLLTQADDGEALAGYSVLTDHPGDQTPDAERVIIIFTPVATPDQAPELNQTFWTQTIEIEVIDGPQAPGMLSRRVKITLARIHALIAADRTLGGRLQDIQEIDLAGTQAEGRDVHGASVQYRAEFYTARDDWFTILGQSGETF